MSFILADLLFGNMAGKKYSIDLNKHCKIDHNRKNLEAYVNYYGLDFCI